MAITTNRILHDYVDSGSYTILSQLLRYRYCNTA